MAYILDGNTIRNPHQITEENSTQYAQIRSLDGTISRDHFGDNKRSWTLKYTNTSKNEYDVIYAIYASYLNTDTTKTFEVTDTNYTIASTYVHVDLVSRDFNVRGTDYISDFDLILTEA